MAKAAPPPSSTARRPGRGRVPLDILSSTRVLVARIRPYPDRSPSPPPCPGPRRHSIVAPDARTTGAQPAPPPTPPPPPRRGPGCADARRPDRHLLAHKAVRVLPEQAARRGRGLG